MGDWIVASTMRFTSLTFWPLSTSYPSTVDGYARLIRPVAFSPDGKWLATSWGDGSLRLWPIPGSVQTEFRMVAPPGPTLWTSLAFDPNGRYLFAVGNEGQARIVPLDGSSPRRLQGFSVDTLLFAAAVSPSGRRVATASWYGNSDKSLRVWDVETGEERTFALPEIRARREDESTTGYERGIASLDFADESTLYTAGDGGLVRWNLDTGTREAVDESALGFGLRRGSLRLAKGVALVTETQWGRWSECSGAKLHDLASGTFRDVSAFGECSTWSGEAVALDASGSVAAVGTLDGLVRIGRLSGGEPHLLVGHRGAVDRSAISPDLRWVATTGEDNTLRLWPMPDLSKPPLHTLPRQELLTRLRSLTNLRVVRDPSSGPGWKVEVGPFPGWKDVPKW